MIIKLKKSRLIFAFPLVAVLAILFGQQVGALASTKAEIGGISISTGDFVATATSSAFSNSSDFSSVTTPQGTIDQMVTEMKAGNTVAVYNLMSTEFRDTFTLANFEEGWNEGGEQIISVENLPTTQTLPEGWYEQQIVAKTQSGKADKFNLVLHLENNIWVIYATEPLT